VNRKVRMVWQIEDCLAGGAFDFLGVEDGVSLVSLR
jgi:hypothetical protein